MLAEICDFVHNYFELKTLTGSFEITNGAISLPEGSMFEGQRFRIQGSALNDGIYTYTAAEILDDDGENATPLETETFAGTVTLMGVPRPMILLAREAKAWSEANRAVLDSPYTSESFGGYAYTKATGSGSNAGGAFDWQDRFRSRLNAYRKIG